MIDVTASWDGTVKPLTSDQLQEFTEARHICQNISANPGKRDRRIVQIVVI